MEIEPLMEKSEISGVMTCLYATVASMFSLFHVTSLCLFSVDSTPEFISLFVRFWLTFSRGMMHLRSTFSVFFLLILMIVLVLLLLQPNHQDSIFYLFLVNLYHLKQTLTQRDFHVYLKLLLFFVTFL